MKRYRRNRTPTAINDANGRIPIDWIAPNRSGRLWIDPRIDPERLCALETCLDRSTDRSSAYRAKQHRPNRSTVRLGPLDRSTDRSRGVLFAGTHRIDRRIDPNLLDRSTDRSRSAGSIHGSIQTCWINPRINPNLLDQSADQSRSWFLPKTKSKAP